MSGRAFGRSAFRRVAIAAVGVLSVAFMGVGSAPQALAPVLFHPAVSDFQFLSGSETPPTQAQCASVGRRCFNPTSLQNSYNLGPLYAQNFDGRGITIAVVDSFGSETMPHDLHVFDTAFGLPHMCGEEGVTCAAGMPKFSVLRQGNVNTDGQPANSGTGLETHNLWALEVALDVEWAHSVAPMANILLVTTPTAETLGVQGFPNFFLAENFVITNHLADVISQSFASAEEAFGSTQSLLNLRYAFEAAKAAGVTMFAASGDGGTANSVKQPPKIFPTIPFPTVEWPASDPLVTGVGGTYLCTDANTGTFVDSVNPPSQCPANPGVREVGWIDSGGGFSHVFARPDFQNTLPAGSTAIPAVQRGVPDVASQASSRTGVLVYITNPGYTGIVCGTDFCSKGWYVVGGTSASSPEWAAMTAIADQISKATPGFGDDLGYINPALYAIGSNPARYAADFYDVTTGNNGAAAPAIPGYPATTGWDPVTGLGTPNAAVFLPDLVQAVHGH
jgi:subtilase family serine protease